MRDNDLPPHTLRTFFRLSPLSFTSFFPYASPRHPIGFPPSEQPPLRAIWLYVLPYAYVFLFIMLSSLSAFAAV